MAEIGRPTVMTPETIKVLTEEFLKGASDAEACYIAGIAPSTLYAHCQENPEFSDKKENLKGYVKYRAKMNIQDRIKAGDEDMSKWYLERRDPEFKPKQEQDNKGHVTVQILKYDELPEVPKGA